MLSPIKKANNIYTKPNFGKVPSCPRALVLNPQTVCSVRPLAGNMTGVRAVQATLAVAWASLYVATGFTTPLVCNKARGLALLSSFSTRTASSPVQQARGSRGLSALQATGGEDDGIDEYKRQMEDFMAQAHEKRLEAMEAVKAEVQRGYEDQIAELQAKASAVVIR